MSKVILNAFSERSLKRDLESLNTVKQAAFGASCCDRLLPNYRLYQADESTGSIIPLLAATSRIWDWIQGAPVTRKEIKALSDDCMRVAPDIDESKSVYSVYALFSCGAICAVLDFIKSQRVSSIVIAAGNVTDSIDNFVQVIEKMAKDSDQREQLILSHPLMQKELRSQRDSLEYLKNQNIFDSKEIKIFRSKFRRRNVLCSYV